MGYNIDNWKTKKLDSLLIPYAAFFRHARRDWHPKEPVMININTGELSLACGCEQSIHGFLRDGQFEVSKFEMSGEGSGTFYHWILRPALQESKGTLEAVLIWEGGDSINSLKVKNGKVTETDIEL